MNCINCKIRKVDGWDFCNPCVGTAIEFYKQKVLNPSRHPTEQKYPLQCTMFKKITEKMYQLHLDKNFDYSPSNMLATGMDGAVVRLWDKIARIMNLCGFDILTGTRNEIKEPKNESLEDSFFDAANYSIIALILKAGKWGK